jgi:uncharacterized integral membrane protein (TIGR00698 family)
MLDLNKKNGGMAKGILFVTLLSLVAICLTELPFLKDLQVSPLLIGLVLGIFVANTIRNQIPAAWKPGILYSMKNLLRIAIVFYGFRITFQDIASVGLDGMAISIMVVTLTFVFGYQIGTRLLKLDRDTTILTCAGASICGAAAVLATESVVRNSPHKGAVAVATVVLFGTLSMFLYPLLYQAGLVPLNLEEMGVYIGGSLYEVAHVVAAGNAISEDTAETAVIVKMIRVMLIAPFLMILSYQLAKSRETDEATTGSSFIIPWFAVLFVVMAGVNSLHILPTDTIHIINTIDTFALTMAMCALGMETSIDKFKGVGLGPIYLAALLFVWLIFGGFAITKGVLAIM